MSVEAHSKNGVTRRVCDLPVTIILAEHFI